LQGRPAAPVVNYYDSLKIIAIGAMIVDHLNDYCGVHSLWLTAIGRVAMPLFLFMVGFNRSSRIGWQLVCGFLCVLPLQWELRGTLLPLNILFPIGLSRFAPRFYERLRLGRTPYLELAVVIGVICAAFTSLVWEYGRSHSSGLCSGTASRPASSWPRRGERPAHCS
jgi:hypothetical protein